MIQCVQVEKSYKIGRSKTNVIRKLDMTINDGELVAILGKSGSGKSTLLNLIGTLDSADAGSIVINGTDLDGITDAQRAKLRKTEIGFVMQDYALVNHQTAEFNIELPMILNNIVRKQRKARVEELAEKVGILSLLGSRVIDLSGGEKQRTAIARALVNDPDIILADEPTGALDVQTSSQIMDLFEKINREGKTVVIVTHDMNIAERCKRIVKIQDGICVSQ